MKVKEIEVDDGDYRRIAEIYFNKKLEFGEVVHHIDGNHENNKPGNLVIMKRGQHSKLHVIYHQKRILCANCLYVSIYETMQNDEWTDKKEDILHSIAEKMLPGCKFNEEIAKMFYEHSVEWKEESNHDCYLRKNMGCVRL